MTFLGAELATVAATVLGSAVAAFGVLAVMVRKAAVPEGKAAGADARPVAMLFGAGYVHDATDAALRMLGRGEHDTITWPDLRAAFARRFPDFPDAPPAGRCIVAAQEAGDAANIAIEPENGLLRIELSDRAATSGDLHQLADQAAELAFLRVAMTAAPNPIWQTGSDGRMAWCNTAYGRLCEDVGHNDADAPVLALDHPDAAAATQQLSGRCRVVERHSGKERWFEATSIPNDDGWMNYATDIAAVVNGEVAQRNFVQTLTKTFAHLPIGLAVFDRNRQLALFNPALIDLTALPADFLSGRPNLLSFFDHLRDGRMMPEPKSYRSWRDQLAELVQAATDDRYSETWSLPSGLTYKITGRPHPDGAIAFLIEDISSEITLTRRFRAELELSHSALDTLDEAVAIFTHLGVLNFSNATYRTMWKSDPDSSFAEMTVIDASRDWQAMCHPNPAWGEMRDFVIQTAERAPWEARITRLDGTEMLASIVPISGGHTMIRFAVLSQTQVPADPPESRAAAV